MSSQRLLTRGPLLAVGTVAGITGSAYYYMRNRPRPTFDIPIRVRDSNGRSITTAKSLPLLEKAKVESLLTAVQEQSSVARGGVKWTWHTAQLASNEPIEDTMAQQWSPRQNNVGEHLYFAVMDGHGGPWTSKLLEKIIIPSVAFELQLLGSTPPTEYVPHIQSSTLSKLTDSLSHIWQSKTPANTVRFDEDPKYVSAAIQNAFARIDSEIVNAPFKLLSQTGVGLDDSMALPTLLPSLSGSCALLAFIDTATKDLYVACTGDSRAVAGYYDPESSRWYASVLTEDQTAKNPSEVLRLQSEHPEDEKASVVSNGRILGNLEPSRAFGDARYKWPLSFQQELARKVEESPLKDALKLRPPPAKSKTPPYVTSQPQITHQKLPLSQYGEAVQGSDVQKRHSRFIVLATDGLWDELSSEEVVSLVGEHLNGTRGVVSKDKFSIATADSVQQIHGKAPRSHQQDTGSWHFVDENLATHLIRNAFGSGPDPDKLSRLLSIPAPYSRRFRDDTSITVVVWEADDTPLKAKL